MKRVLGPWSLVLGLGLLACAGGGDDVSIRWTFAGQACETAGVRTVHVFVGPLAPEGSWDHEVSCAVGETGLTLRGVSPGHHVLVVKGLAADRVRYELSTEIDVPEGGMDLGTVDLPPYQPPP